MKKTGTYRGDQKPVRVGLYERKHSNRCWAYSWWNGMCWGLSSYNPDEAVLMKKRASCIQAVPWRGVEK